MGNDLDQPGSPRSPVSSPRRLHRCLGMSLHAPRPLCRVRCSRGGRSAGVASAGPGAGPPGIQQVASWVGELQLLQGLWGRGDRGCGRLAGSGRGVPAVTPFLHSGPPEPQPMPGWVPGPQVCPVSGARSTHSQGMQKKSCCQGAVQELSAAKESRREGGPGGLSAQPQLLCYQKGFSPSEQAPGAKPGASVGTVFQKYPDQQSESHRHA